MLSSPNEPCAFSSGQSWVFAFAWARSTVAGRDSGRVESITQQSTSSSTHPHTVTALAPDPTTTVAGSEIAF
jgi:hypothetical protein